MQRTRLQPVRQLLGSLPVLAANQGIIYQLITNPSLIQLAGQPVVTIEIHLQAQWQPSGHSHMDQAQLLVHPIQIVMQTRPPASDHLRVAVGPRVTRIKHRGALLDCKDMDQSGSSASLLENRRNPVLLPKVLSRHHFDIDLMAARQTDDVVSNLPGDRLSETRQVSRAKSRLIHGNQQCAWVRNIHQCALDNDPIKTTQLTGTFLGVAAFQVGAQSRFQRGSSRSGSSHERLLYSSLWFWLCQFRNSDLYTPRTLKLDLTRRGRLPFDECLDLALALTTALEHLHQNGLMHRDIKPANIIFVNGQPKLADIGLVVGIDATKSFVGTEGYIPPEGPTTPQADIYSLGKVLYEAATGRDRQDFPELPTQVMATPEQSSLMELNEVILKACATDPEHRYQKATEMHADLLLLKTGKSVKHTRGLERRLRVLTRIGITAAVLITLALGGFVYQKRQAQRALEISEQEVRLRQQAEDARAQEALQAQKATAKAQESLDRLVRLLNANGIDLMEKDELAASLPWFTE